MFLLLSKYVVFGHMHTEKLVFNCLHVIRCQGLGLVARTSVCMRS